MKKFFTLAVLALTALTISASEANAPVEENILSAAWGNYGKAETRGIQSFRKGIFTIENKAGQQSGYYQSLKLKKPATTLTITGESRAENVAGTNSAGYCLYADIYFENGQSLWGQHVSFKSGTHDWEKVELVVPTGRKINSITFYILFRNMTGKVQFRNIKVTAK